MIPPCVVVRSGKSLERETASHGSCHCQGGGQEEECTPYTQAHTQQGCHHLNTNVHSQSTSQPLSHLLHTAPGGTEQVLTSQFFNFIYICPAAPGPRWCMWAFTSCGEWQGYSLVLVGGLLIGVACDLNSCGAQA